MGAVIAAVSSITQAIKGQKALEKQGISSYIERSDKITDTNGCGYSLRIFSNLETVKQILLSEAVNVKKFTTAGR